MGQLECSTHCVQLCVGNGHVGQASQSQCFGGTYGETEKAVLNYNLYAVKDQWSCTYVYLYFTIILVMKSPISDLIITY